MAVGICLPGGSRDPKHPVPPSVVALKPEHYNRTARLAEKKILTRVEFDIQTEFLKG
jgi:carboxypeptidase Q